jgi:hypothetical protein
LEFFIFFRIFIDSIGVFIYLFMYSGILIDVSLGLLVFFIYLFV